MAIIPSHSPRMAGSEAAYALRHELKIHTCFWGKIAFLRRFVPQKHIISLENRLKF
jgi:hypothetical protein